jgi:hypothetical protein
MQLQADNRKPRHPSNPVSRAGKTNIRVSYTMRFLQKNSWAFGGIRIASFSLSTSNAYN